MIMQKLFFLLGTLCFFACNNQSADTSRQDTTAKKTTIGNTTILSRESELEILDGCIDNAKGNVGESRAYAICKCVLGQVQEKYPTADSSDLVMHLSDTAEVARMVLKCK
jgi:hypothetical protein